MKFIVEVEEFWLDEENIASGLQRNITHEVVQKIQKLIADRVEKQLEVEIKRRVEETLYSHITACIKDHIATGTVKGRYNGGDPMLITDWIKEQFTNSDYTQNINKQVQAVAKQLAESMKVRYDMLFASQIVNKMNANGFLKEDVGKLLLETPPGQ